MLSVRSDTLDAAALATRALVAACSCSRCCSCFPRHLYVPSLLLVLSTCCMHACARRARLATHVVSSLLVLPFCSCLVLLLLLVLSSPFVLSTLRLRLFYGDFSRTGAPALYTHAL